MPQIAKRPFMAAVMRSKWRSVKSFPAAEVFGTRHNLAATSPRIVKGRANFSPVNRRI
jgi:hypothetical protein